METPPENEQLENYLDRLCVWLILTPEAEREELRAELRQHFHSLATAEVMRGATQAEAVTAALNRMGDADELGRRLKQAWQSKMTRQMQQLMPADAARLQKRTLFAIKSWGVISAVAWIWPNFFLPYNSWTLDLVGSAIIGAGYGLLLTFHHSKLSLIMPPLPKQKAQSLAEMAITLPTLPSNASFGGKAEYRRSQNVLGSAKDYYQRVSENPASQFPMFTPLPMPLKVLAIIALVALAQSQSQAHTVDHSIFIVARQFAELFTLFAAQDFVAATAGRFTRKSQAQ